MSPNPHDPPPHHDAAMAYMLERPGTSYEQAYEQVAGRPLPTPAALYEEAAEPRDDLPPPPWYHQPAIAYMNENVGTGYDEAVGVVKKAAARPEKKGGGDGRAYYHVTAPGVVFYDRPGDDVVFVPFR